MGHQRSIRRCRSRRQVDAPHRIAPCILAYLVNTTVLALLINIGASMF
jgi:hypothetical protein